VHTLIVILVALISVILAVAAKYGDLDKKVIVDIAKIELDKRSDFVKIIFLIKNLIFIWSAWTYGAFYLASIFFLWILLNAWFTQIVEKTVNAMKDRAVEIVAGREE
jgi:hypothetical protein